MHCKGDIGTLQRKLSIGEEEEAKYGKRRNHLAIVLLIAAPPNAGEMSIAHG